MELRSVATLAIVLSIFSLAGASDIAAQEELRMMNSLVDHVVSGLPTELSDSQIHQFTKLVEQKLKTKGDDRSAVGESQTDKTAPGHNEAPHLIKCLKYMPNFRMLAEVQSNCPGYGLRCPDGTAKDAHEDEKDQKP